MQSKNKSVECREFAIRILSATTLEEKINSPDFLSDEEPGEPFFWDEPVRPPGMHFQRHSKADKLPSFHEHHDPDKIAICLHRFAGHELLAVEMMAFALLAFPHAPKTFRKGVLNTLKEEQGHVKLYMKRMNELGLSFGDLPLYRHFWAHTPFIRSPSDYVSMISLTFEQANLDFAPHYGSSFARHGDELSSTLMQQILLDEIRHVSFGMRWLKKFHAEKEESLWDYWKQCQKPYLNPGRAKGFIFSEEPRIEAGIPDDWIKKMRHL